MTPSATAWSAVRRVLCVRLDTLGDVLMTTPALRAVREHADGCHVTLLTSRPGAAVAALVPVVDDVIVYDAPWLKATPFRNSPALDLEMIHRLQREEFDAAVIFTVFSQSALPSAQLCYLAGIPLRLAHARENPYQLLTSWVPDPEPAAGIRHEVERQLALVEHVGFTTPDTRLALRVPDEARCRIRARLAALGLGARAPWILIHPGATAPSRRYPAERFGDVGRMVADDLGATVLVTGDGSERALAAEVCAAAGPRATSLAGELSLDELAALVEAAPLVITNNTGPAHMAAALGTPVVDIYALTNPQHTPWQVPNRVLSHDVPCRHCFRSICPAGHNDCIRGIPAADVAHAAHDLFVETHRTASRLTA